MNVIVRKVVKKRRRLKKWVKVVIFFIFFCSICFFLKGTYSLPEQDFPINDEYSDNINNDLINDSSLDRVTYKDGFYYEELSDEIKKKITGGSFPLKFSDNFTSISYEDLNYVRVKYYDFKGIEHTDGELIVNKLVAQDIVEIFYELYLKKYPIASIKLVEEYQSIDELSMSANNTSAFCYRIVENIDRLSWHAFGVAIDINPLYNPYIVGNNIYPSNANRYTDRTLDFEGKINYTDLAYKLFTKYGWKWGGDFTNTKDYQHFYKEIFDDKIRERSE